MVALMWKIATRGFTLQEILIMACNECCIPRDGDRQERAKYWHCRHAPRFNRLQEIVMAKVIEFYMPKNFRKPLRTAAQPQLGKIIEFCPQTKRSA